MIAALVFVVAPALLSGLKVQHRGVEPHPPPDQHDDGYWGSKDSACAACKYTATGSCAMYHTCLCYAVNTYFAMPGEPATDQDNWMWACGNEGGDRFELCFAS